MKLILSILLICLLPPLVSTASQSNELRTVALSGQAAPLTEVGTSFLSFRNSVVNNLGQVAFQSSLAGSGINSTNDSSLWTESYGSDLSLVARKGEQPQGIPPGLSIEFFSNAILNDAGQVTFRANLKGDGVTANNDGVIWWGDEGTLVPIAREGELAPDALSYNTLELPRMNATGEIAFREHIGTDVIRGIWLHDEIHGVVSVARTGDQAPGLPAGATFSSFGDPSLNDLGQSVFEARVNSLGVNGIWSDDGSGELKLLAQTRGDAPGTPTGVLFGFFSDPVINSLGQSAFGATLQGSGVGNNNNSSVWMQGPSGNLTLVAREGGQVPGEPSGTLFSSLDSARQVINESGQLAFYGFLTGTGVTHLVNNQAIWTRGLDGQISSVVRMGSQAPGTPDGVLFSGLGSPAINATGQVAFSAYLTGIGVDDSNNIGIWAQDNMGNLRLIARTGDTIDIIEGSSTDSRVMSSIDSILMDNSYVGLSGNGDGRPSAFNDLGQMTFSVTFDDGSAGVFVSNLVAVPEPRSSMAVLTIICLCFSRVLPRKTHN